MPARIAAAFCRGPVGVCGRHAKVPSRMKRFERWLVVAGCAAVGWFYFWTVDSNGEAWNFGEEQRD